MKQDQDNRTEKRKIGDLGEEKACVFLVKLGFEIVERNYLRKWGEIDIIAIKDNKLHFIEVKTVSYSRFSRETDSYRPEDNVHSWKLKRLGRVIQTYLLSYNNRNDVSYETNRLNKEVSWQFDLITVYLDLRAGKFEVEYLEDIIL